VGKDGQNFNQF